MNYLHAWVHMAAWVGLMIFCLIADYPGKQKCGGKNFLKKDLWQTLFLNKKFGWKGNSKVGRREYYSSLKYSNFVCALCFLWKLTHMLLEFVRTCWCWFVYCWGCSGPSENCTVKLSVYFLWSPGSWDSCILFLPVTRSWDTVSLSVKSFFNDAYIFWALLHEEFGLSCTQWWLLNCE